MVRARRHADFVEIHQALCHGLHLITIRLRVSDLASRFRFAVHLNVRLAAEQVAAGLKALFLHGSKIHPCQYLTLWKFTLQSRPISS